MKTLMWDKNITILDTYNKNFDFVITLKENELLPAKKIERWYSPMDRSLRRELKSCFRTLVSGLTPLRIKR